MKKSTLLVLAVIFLSGCFGPSALQLGSMRVDRFFKAKKYAEAGRMLADLIGKYPENYRLRANYARASYFDNNVEQAVSILENASELAAGRPSHYVLLGTLYLESGREKNGEKALQKAIEFGDESVGVMSPLGKLAFRKMQAAKTMNAAAAAAKQAAEYFDKAILSLREIIEKQPAGVQKKMFYKELDNIIRQRAFIAVMFEKDAALALTLDEEYLSRNPSDTFVWARFCLIMHAAGKTDEALKRINKAVEKQGTLEMHMAKAQLLLSSGNIEEAGKHVKEVAEKFPDKSAATGYEAKILHMQKKVDEALATILDGLEKFPGDQGLVQFASAIYEEKKDYDAIIKMIDREIAKVEDAKKKAWLEKYRAGAEDIMKYRSNIEKRRPINATSENFASLERKNKMRALLELQGSNDAEHVKIFLLAAKDEDPIVRVFAVQDLGFVVRKGEPLPPEYKDILKAVEAALSDKHENVRAAAAACLENWKMQEYARKVLPLLEDEIEYVREVAAGALRSLTGKHFDFEPAAEPVERAAAIEKWRVFLNKAEKKR